MKAIFSLKTYKVKLGSDSKLSRLMIKYRPTTAIQLQLSKPNFDELVLADDQRDDNTGLEVRQPLSDAIPRPPPANHMSWTGWRIQP
ncbi:hypothetical protein RRF57_011210 [Xylaria bambusicola]|uniref:Uncharacterized protein n=1 Tax=Xylaria bambusicola TaxID=326684 RepID=A0AAN7ZDZ7_9PEZI